MVRERANIETASNLSKDNTPFQRGSFSSTASFESEHSHLLELELEEASWKEDLPPQDRGAEAWKVLIGCWLLEVSWGFPMSFGVFQSYYSMHPLFEKSTSTPTIGALALGFPYLLLPLTSPLCLKFPNYQLHVMFLGWFLCISSLVLASFATQTWHLILTQGALYGIGWCVCYTPFLIILNGWFDQRRGLAYGMLFAASGTSGLVLPFVLETLLSKYGFRIAIRSYVIAYVIISTPSFWLVRPRLPLHVRKQEADTNTRSQSLQRSSGPWYSVLLSPTTLVISASIFLQGLAFPLPPTFLPSYSTAIALPPSAGDSLLAIASLSQVVGLILLGWFSDHVSHHIPHSLSSLVSGLACLLLWGPAKGLGSLAMFATLWGGFAGPYSVLWTRMSAGLAAEGGEEQEVVQKTMLLYSWFSFERGVAGILAGPFSELLVGKEITRSSFGLGKWTGVVSFSGIVLLLSAAGGLMWFWERWTRQRGR